MADDFIMGSETYTPQMNGMPTKGTQKILNIFFVIDTSGSMRLESRIQAVNEAFIKMIPVLKKVQRDCMSKFELRIAIMTFDETARWIVAPTPILEYNHEEIECSQWVTYFSRAFRTLGDKLTRNEYMAYTGKIAEPYIMFMTDGEPSKEDNYEPELESLLENGWFQRAQRFAVLIGKDTINSPSARAAVEKFVSNTTEGIIDAADAKTIAAEVQAKTIHTVVNMTKHNVMDDLGESAESDSNKEDDNGFADFGGGGFDEDADGFGDFGDFEDFGDFGDVDGFDDGKSFI